MRRFNLALVATTALTLGATAAAAQGWMPINSRQEALDRRIDTGVRNGDLTRAEAVTLRNEFNAIANLETRYRANGLSQWERADLDARFDRLSSRIRFERTDNDQRGWRDQRDWYGGRDWTDNRGRWVNIEQRKIQLDNRIEQGVRSGQLTASEAARLRAEFDAIARVEYRYRRNGLNPRERADLDQRFDALAQQIRFERRDENRRYGYNRP
jgi:hypothetical protein